ncbi:hypothetical protein SAMN02745121_06992 [Nannocystis exedens]|uniref:Uncharacterized protein n=1 Tax=Nannocystis exedens TaxID=54 RepID=A0A1I2G0M3_9BACT|nr:hypothetical protein [Nannocystis exedens]PCC74627.1 hypothetical protein NAEX_07724 [Nannocystis exedens]SFF11102.1 hypothetical protein SAMN02745121_06992 [Nannocystis exedens]
MSNAEAGVPDAPTPRARVRLAAALLLAGCPAAPIGTTDDPATTTSVTTTLEPATTIATSETATTLGTSGPFTTATAGDPLPTATTGDDPTTTGTTLASTTEPDPPPAVALALITDDNRAYVEMHGGWGPHLRGLMRASDDSLWFCVDAGEDVHHNRTIRYFRRGAGEPAWSLVAEQPHTDGIQQNAASVLVGSTILTYGVNIQQHFLEECSLDTADPAVRACNAVLVGGQVYTTPPASNYVGAAVLGPGARVVWFTVVGEGGGPGRWVYTYNYGGGWNGPVEVDLGGANDLGYVHAMASPGGQLQLVGQAFTGAYPDGTYAAVVADVTMGQVPTFLSLEPPDPAAQIRSGADLFHDGAGDTHVLAAFDGVVAYYHRPGGASWAGHTAPLHVFPDTYRARFVRPAGDRLWLVRGSIGGQGVQLLRAPEQRGGPVDWAAAEVVDVTSPGPGFAAPSALYVESPTYQLAPAGALEFAVCGQYQVGDRSIWHGRLM